MLASALQKLKPDGKESRDIARIYASSAAARARISTAAGKYCMLFADEEVQVLSAPGRTEVGGNHTDYNQGAVLAAAVNLDTLAVAAPQQDGRVTLFSEGFGKIELTLDTLAAQPQERETSAALVRGVAYAMQQRGYRVGGFRAYVTSEVMGGSGLSSSAAFEVLLAAIQSHLYNAGKLPAREAAVIGRQAENMYFGKPCGLMDQMACAVGGFIKIDFADADNPEITPIAATPEGFVLCIVDTRGDHAGLTEEYAAASAEAFAVAQALGGRVLRDSNMQALVQNAARIRETCGDRAFLRAAHFYADTARVHRQADALRAGDIPTFLALVNESGRSSFQYLQNVYVAADSRHQPVAMALCLSEYLLACRGACRVHGGGFAGTIQAWAPEEGLEQYRTGMDAVFGTGSCAIPGIRQVGMARIL